MIKYVLYKGNVYTIQYECLKYEPPRYNIYVMSNCILKIIEVNKRDLKENSLPYPCLTWRTHGLESEESIIAKTKELIDTYLYLQKQKENFSYEKEFENWDGILDYWDE